MKSKKLTQGHAAIMLLIFVVVGVAVISASITMNIVQSQSALRYEQSTSALQLAETGVENALLRLLRDPSYTGETLTTPEGSTTINVVGATTQTITATASSGTAYKTLQVRVDRSTGALNITSWSEIF